MFKFEHIFKLRSSSTACGAIYRKNRQFANIFWSGLSEHFKNAPKYYEKSFQPGLER